MSRVTLGNLGRSHSAEKQVCIVLAIDSRLGPNTQDSSEHTAHSFRGFSLLSVN